jgi:hypothetical protein
VWQYDFETDSFTGYKVRGDLIGYLGAGGFVSSKARVKPFGEFHGFTAWTGKDPSAVMMMWQTKRRIYQIDFRSRKVETIFNSPESDVVLVQWHQWRPMNHKDRDASDIRYRPSIDCITADYCHHLVMREPNQIITIKLPEQMWLIRTIRYKMSKVNFVATADNIFLKYYEKGYNPPQPLKLLSQYRYEYNSKPRPQSLQLYKVTDNGSLELVSRFDWIRPAMKIMSVPDRRAVTLNWASVVSPPVFNLLWYIFGDELYEFGAEQIGIIQLYAQIITELRPRYGLLNYILSGAMMAFAFWHGRSRRTSWARLILWLIIVGAFNLAGLLTYLGLNHTPVIGCPVCGEKRGLERPDCVRCGSGLPAPQRKPTDLIMSGASI